MGIIKPPRLNTGDTITIISPSAGLAALAPHRLDQAVSYFQRQGYNVKEMASTRTICRWESAPAKQRAKDIMDAFADDDSNAILCSIGGNVAISTLQYLDFEEIRKSPKIFCGYSDISILHYALHRKAELMTYYGPNAMVQFGEYPEPLEYTLSYFLKALSENAVGRIQPSHSWTDDTPDWMSQKDLEGPRKLHANSGYQWLREGKASGPIIGGCLNSIVNLIGSEYWPDHNGRILFIETAEGHAYDLPTPLPEVAELLDVLKLAGIFNAINGLIIGRPYKFTGGEVGIFREILMETTEDYTFPILYGADIGHTDPQITIPLGSQCWLNSGTNTFALEVDN